MTMDYSQLPNSLVNITININIYSFSISEPFRKPTFIDTLMIEHFDPISILLIIPEIAPKPALIGLNNRSFPLSFTFN